jgi:murein DD-endopeptidase MepM/ murein hydrolase activator NlpD
MECRNKYALPVRKGDIIAVRRRMLYAKKGVVNHSGKLRYSVDFIVAAGTPAYAAAAGTVVWLRNNSNEGGPSKKYWFKGNRIVIKHKNGEYSAYEHLKYRSSKVKVGQHVKKGQLIAYNGSTGYSYGPHLHFEVFCKPAPDESEGTTLHVAFKRP